MTTNKKRSPLTALLDNLSESIDYATESRESGIYAACSIIAAMLEEERLKAMDIAAQQNIDLIGATVQFDLNLTIEERTRPGIHKLDDNMRFAIVGPDTEPLIIFENETLNIFCNKMVDIEAIELDKMDELATEPITVDDVVQYALVG